MVACLSYEHSWYKNCNTIIIIIIIIVVVIISPCALLN